MSGVELFVGATANQLNLATRTLSLLDGNELSYEGLVVATGARARPSIMTTRRARPSG